MDRKTYTYGEVIFREGDYQKWMYGICEGAVDIYAGYETPEQKKLITLTQDQLFGEIGMIGMMPRTATAVAASEHLALDLVSYEDLDTYLQAYPQNIQQIMQNVSRRIRELTEDVSETHRSVNELLRQKEAESSAGKRLKGKLKNLLQELRGKRSVAAFVVRETESQRCMKNTPPVVKFYAGQVIFRAGDKAECLYEVYSGKVGIYSDYQTENQKLLTELHSEAVFGEMGLLDDMPRSATAVSLEESSLLMVKKEHFRLFFQKKPMKVLHILQQMCMQLRKLSREYLDLCKTLEDLTVREEMDEKFMLLQLEQLTTMMPDAPYLSGRF